MKWTAGKKRILLTSAVLISASAAFLFLLAGGGPERETRTFPVMGTVCGIDLYGNSGEILSRAADDAQREIRRLEAMFNIYDPDSELSRLNAAAFHHPFRCSEELWEILQQARKYYVLSDGAFDVTVKPLMKLWGFHRRRSAVPAREEIEAAARVAGADGFIRRLAQGYDTVLTQGGAELSQGERQLLTIARAVLAKPPILILDEATSSVDTVTEQKIRRAMVSLTAGRTSFLIAHRLSTIRDSDQIALIEDGRVAELGSHQDLMALNGKYAMLYRTQMGIA